MPRCSSAIVARGSAHGLLVLKLCEMAVRDESSPMVPRIRNPILGPASVRARVQNSLPQRLDQHAENVLEVRDQFTMTLKVVTTRANVVDFLL